MPLNSFISAINEKLSGLVSGSKVYGIAQSVQRGSETLPATISKDGEYTYVGLDDVSPVIIYHKNIAITVSRSTNQKGFGNELPDLINTYSLNMIVYIDHKRACMTPDDFFLFIQANFPDGIKEEPFSFIRVNITSVILNSAQVLKTEYEGSEFKLPPEKSLFQINYNIETTFKKKCFEKCPEVIN